MKKVFFFGDSICKGQGVSVHKGWVNLIAQKLSEVTSQLNEEIIIANPSINGNTTRQALERMPYDVQSYKPDIVLVQFGLNDCNCWQTDMGVPRVSPQAFEANLEEILTRCFIFGAQVVFLNTNHPTGRNEEVMPFNSFTYEENNEKYNNIIRNVAQKDSRVTLIDIEKTFKEFMSTNNTLINDLVLPDLLHLSEKGHQIYFNTVYPHCEKALNSIILQNT